MIITQTITAVPPRNAGSHVDEVRFSHPVLDAPTRRWADGTPGSGHTPRCAPVRFIAPAGGDEPTEYNIERTVYTGPSPRQSFRRVGAESAARTRGRRTV